MDLFSRLATRPVYNTRAVVLRTGVPADTFRAWERRYGVPSPARTGGNQRLYSDRDIALIAWLRDQTRSGVTISQAVEMVKSRDRDNAERAESVRSLAAPEADPETRKSRGLPRYSEQLVDSLVAYDSRAASGLLQEALAIVPVEVVCLDVLQPALYEIGDRWQRDEIPVSEEHFATSFAIRTLGSLFNLSRPEEGRGPVVAACLEGELHEVGLLMTSLFLSRRGCQVVYLGSNLPVGDLVQTIQELRPPVVFLSASTTESAVNLARCLSEIKLTLRAQGRPGYVPEIAFGGKIFINMPFLQEGVDGIFGGRDANAAVEVVERFLDERANPAERA